MKAATISTGIAKRRSRQMRYYRRNREARIAAMMDYQERNPERMRELGRVRDALYKGRLVSAVGVCSGQQWRWRLQFYGGCCAYCGTTLTPEIAQMDHRIPFSRGGTNWPSNLVPACERCNKQKGTKMPSNRFHARMVASK